MPRRGILGLAGGSLVLVILALAYIFTDRGREVGDNLGRSAADRIERLFPDEAGTGEGGGTEPEGVFQPAEPPEITEPAPPGTTIDPSGLPPQRTPLELYLAGLPEGERNSRIAALEAAIIQRDLATASPVGQGMPTPEPPRGVPTIRVFGAPTEPAARAAGFAHSTVSTTDPETGTTSGTAFFVPPANSRTFTAEQRAEYIASRTAPRSETQAREPTTRPTTATSARARNAFNRGRALSTQRQTVSPSRTRPPTGQLTPDGILASVQGFNSGTQSSFRGAQT